MENAVIEDSLLEKLMSFDTPTICNALEIVAPERRLRGFTFKQFVCPFPELPPFVGYARTATIRATHASELPIDEARKLRISYYEYVNAGPKPSIVVIQDLDGAEIGFGSFWGEVQSAVHQGLGCAGVITDGCIRDIPQWAPGLPVLAGSIAPSHAYVHLNDFSNEVRVNGMLVRSNDLIHADNHGAVVIPSNAAAGLPAACELIARKEAVVLDAARSRDFTIAKLRTALEQMDDIH